MNDKIRIRITSDPDFDKLVAEIEIDDQFICLISEGGGAGGPDVVFPEPDRARRQGTQTVGLADFVAALEDAATRLKAF